MSARAKDCSTSASSSSPIAGSRRAIVPLYAMSNMGLWG